MEDFFVVLVLIVFIFVIIVIFFVLSITVIVAAPIRFALRRFALRSAGSERPASGSARVSRSRSDSPRLGEGRHGQWCRIRELKKRWRIQAVA